MKAKAKDPDALYFFQDKFGLVQMIATLQTPYVAVLDGYACKYVECCHILF
jgi:3-hydroxyisobutyryl-CoA hydrolase